MSYSIKSIKKEFAERGVFYTDDFIGVCGLDDSRWIASKEVIGNIHDNHELLKEELQ